MASPPSSNEATVESATAAPEWLHADLRWAVDYWHACRGDRPLPAKASFDPTRVPRPLLPMVFVSENLGEDWLIRLAGTAYRELYEREITGMRLADLVPHSEGGQRLWADYGLAVEKRQPVFTDAHMTWRRSGRLVRYNRVLLPFAADDGDGTAVRYLVGVARVLD